MAASPSSIPDPDYLPPKKTLVDRTIKALVGRRPATLGADEGGTNCEAEDAVSGVKRRTEVDRRTGTPFH